MSEVKKSSELKALTTQISKLQGRLNALVSEDQTISMQINQVRYQINDLNKKISKLKSSGELIITEHAYLRFFERVFGFDLKEIEKQMLSDDIRIKHRTIGDGEYPIIGIQNGKFKVCIKGNTVITITGGRE